MARLPLRSLAAWLVGSLASVALTWANLLPPETPATSMPPPALPRPPTEAELAAVAAKGAELDAALVRARARLGRPLALDELEGVSPEGAPWLGGPLPDSPLQPGHATVQPGCEAHALPPGERPDWLYCAEADRLLPVVD